MSHSESKLKQLFGGGEAIDLAIAIAGLLMLIAAVFTPLRGNAQSQGGYKTLDDKARTELALKLKAKTGISIDEYRKDADAYVVKIEREPDVGPNTTTLEWLLKAVDNGMSEKEMRKNPSKLVGNVFRLKKDLWLLSDEEIEARIAKNKKK